MGQTAFSQNSFLGGEVSQSYQGRVDLQTYRTFMNVCLNSIPTESGTVQRRPGTRHKGLTRGGFPAKLITFDFRTAFPYTAEFTDNFLRFWTEAHLATTNETRTIATIGAGNPAVFTTHELHGWTNGAAVFFPTLVGATQLQGRRFLLTVVSATSFTLIDEFTFTAINGSVLDAFTSGTVVRVHEVGTPYGAGSWANVRAVQAEESAVLLNGTLPQVLTVTKEPTSASDAVFALAPANFLDGPYLDPIPGSWVTASAVSGVVTLTFSFQPYVAAVAYNIGDYVSTGGVSYKSRVANNVGNAPAGSPTQWLVVNGGDPINLGAGFTSADIGRLLRLFSEPDLWNASATYATLQIVAYDDGSGGNQYWKNTSAGTIAANTPPGTSASWSPLVPGAIWTWGRILSVSGTGVVAAASAVGSMTGGGGVAAVIDGTTAKTMAASANMSQSIQTYVSWAPVAWPANTIVQYQGSAYRRVTNTNDNIPPGAPSSDWVFFGVMSNLTIDSYVGGLFAAPTALTYVTVFPTTDFGFTNGSAVHLNVWAKATAPANSTDGTLLGSAGTVANTFAPITILSIDTTTTYSYIWIEITTYHNQPLPDPGSHQYTGYSGIAQIVFFGSSANNGSVLTAAIAGPPMLYSGAMRKWRLGAYGGANGYPLCGTYHEGRAWFSGVIGNRVDIGKTVGSDNNLFNFAPTAPNGTVAADNAITVTFAAPDVNAVLWMTPDQQGVLAGTQAGEWLISPAAPGAMSPTNIAARRVTKIGCADIEPRRTDHTLVFVQKFRRKIMEYFADVYSGKFSAPDLSEKSQHLTKGKIAEIAYQQEKEPIIWQRLDDGTLVGSTYRRDTLTTAQGPTFVAAHRHTFGSGRLIESICVGPSSGGNLDALSMVTSDNVYRHVEVMTDLLDEGFALSSLWMLDDAIVPTSLAVLAPYVGAPYGGLKLNGLWVHNGKTVSVFVAGLDCGVTSDPVNGQPIIQDFVVANGSLTMPFGDGISGGTGGGLFTLDFLTGISATLDLALIPIVVGFTYTSDGQIVRPAQAQESGAQAGAALGKERRIHREATLLYGAVNETISFGVTFDTGRLRPARLTAKDGVTRYTPLQLWSGVTRVIIDADSDFDNMPCWRMSRPNAAAFVIQLGGTVQTQDG